MMAALSRANIDQVIGEVDRCVSFLRTQTERPRAQRLADALERQRNQLQQAVTTDAVEAVVNSALNEIFRLRSLGAMSIASAQTGFPLTFDGSSVAVGDACSLCGDVFSTDDRGLPLLEHPELGRIVVCYRCAGDLG